jgi:MFS family permease
VTISPSEPPQHPWRESGAYLRDIAKWIVGGVVATAAGVLTGTSLSKLGSLDPLRHGWRLGLACLGLLIAFLALGHLMRKSLAVFLIESASVDDVAQARPGDRLNALREEIEAQFKFQAAGYDWPSITGDPATPGLLPAIEQIMPFLYVRQKFKQLIAALPWSVTGLALGLVVFAWAANPPPDPPRADKGVSIKISE